MSGFPLDGSDVLPTQNYVSPESLKIYVSAFEKGIFLWLAPESGTAAVTVTPHYGVYSGPFDMTYVIHPSQNVANPIFLRMPSSDEFFQLSIRPLDPAKPVRLTQLRVAYANENVAAYRKKRFLTEPSYFVATSGDPRAPVSGEIASIFAPIHVLGEGREPNPNSCGNYKIIDATCTPATAGQISQNWAAKAQQAANGTYNGPTLRPNTD